MPTCPKSRRRTAWSNVFAVSDWPARETSGVEAPARSPEQQLLGHRIDGENRAA